MQWRESIRVRGRPAGARGRSASLGPGPRREDSREHRQTADHMREKTTAGHPDRLYWSGFSFQDRVLCLVAAVTQF